jgi:hypothetical protein
MISRHPVLQIAFVLGLLGGLSEFAQPGPAWGEQPDLQQVFKAWRQRAEKCKSVRVAYRQDQADHYLLHWFSDKETVGRTEMVHYSLQCTLMIQGPNIRYEFDGQQPRVELVGELKNHHRLSTFDGTTSKAMSYPNEYVKYPMGHVFAEKHSEAVTNINTAPIRWHVSPLDKRVAGFHAEALSVAPHTETLDGQTLLVLPFADPQSDDQKAFWVDPSRDFVIVRYVTIRKGKLASQTDIEYEPDSLIGWRPVRWNRFRPAGDGGPPITVVSTTVTDFEVNAKLPPDVFTLEFLPGTRVYDESQGGQAEYLVTADNQRRDILDFEIGATHDQLLASGTGQAFSTHPRGAGWPLWRWIALGTTGLAMALFAIRYFRRS